MLHAECCEKGVHRVGFACQRRQGARVAQPAPDVTYGTMRRHTSVSEMNAARETRKIGRRGGNRALIPSLALTSTLMSSCRLLAGGDESSAHPPHLPLSWLGWPSMPTLPQLWLAPAVSPGPLYAALGPREEGSQRAHGDPQLRSPALGSPASNHLLELLLSLSPCILPPTLLLFFLLHCLLLFFFFFFFFLLERAMAKFNPHRPTLHRANCTSSPPPKKRSFLATATAELL
ncbi:unnamed protein product [Pleuronectes platessa]|uniref:Uncharacterized protein n=1 Tax=Pleuronectes platessa TaxID=8262 RepID=A0A9N7Z2N2_PLEPL|nr:unnamed protein product [Pleuronectes platessa]